ncbi:FlgD immunoglobulin-like domain containing protein [Rhodocaloribacter sp.]
MPSGVEAPTVTLAWNAPVEATGLTYNLRVGRTPGGGEVVAAAADPATGRLRLARAGNVFHNTAWTLRGLPNGTYHWSVQAIDPALRASPFAAEGVFTVTDAVSVVTDAPDDLPARVTLHPAFPNPFRETTTLRFELPRPERVTVRVYDVLGARVATLFDGPAEAGAHTAVWDGRDAAGRPAGAGVYFVELRVGARVRTSAVLRIR